MESSSRIPHWATADATAWEVARKREAVIRPLSEVSSLTSEQVKEAAQALALGRTLVYRLVARYRRRPYTSSLLPRIRGRARRVRLLDPTLESVIEPAIDTIYLTEQRPRMADLMRALVTQCRQQQLPAPSYRTMKRRVDAIDRKSIVARRLGTRAAQQAFATSFVEGFMILGGEMVVIIRLLGDWELTEAGLPVVIRRIDAVLTKPLVTLVVPMSEYFAGHGVDGAKSNEKGDAGLVPMRQIPLRDG